MVTPLLPHHLPRRHLQVVVVLRLRLRHPQAGVYHHLHHHLHRPWEAHRRLRLRLHLLPVEASRRTYPHRNPDEARCSNLFAAQVFTCSSRALTRRPQRGLPHRLLVRVQTTVLLRARLEEEEAEI